METGVLDTSNASSPDSDNLVLDSDLYDVDTYDVPDPGLLSEKNELCSVERLQGQQFFTGNERWQTLPLQTRARHLWLVLRTYLHDIVEKEKRAELRVARLTHGLEPLRRLEVEGGLCSVAQDAAGGHFVVLDGTGRLHQHTKDGWVQRKLQAPVALTGLVAVPDPLGAVGRFVGWGPAGLAILRRDLSLLWLSQPWVGRALGQEPTTCLPVPNLGLLLMAEVSGSLALWKFRSGGRRLVPYGLPLQPPPGLAGALQRLALGPMSARHLRHCFAAFGSAVLTFDLDNWALVEAHQDLHKTTISDLAYCKEVEAMVTASRDSTVKVWEADWQIRMVFVGHTGPVTAMTVLPNTILVVSASQDGTLRTWDLQSAEQVGEVALGYWCQDALSERVNRLLAPAGPGWPVLSLCSNSVELWRVRDLYSPLSQLPAPVLHLQVAPVLPAPAEPSLPARLVCACADGSVYLVSAATGRTVSALLLEPEDCAAAVAYCLPREALWVLTRAGHLVRANAARCPMVVLHRVCPPPPPAPQPCSLHLYCHLIDPVMAFHCWEIVRQHGGDLRRSGVAWSWKNKNRYLPVVGHTDGALSVLDWRSSNTIFHTEAHSPGPVTAIASTWNSVVSSGGDLTVKMWRVFPYAEESLSLLRTFSCCHPVVMLCALGKRITVGFEDPESATYGLVQFGLGDRHRFDHRPQDDPKDHITGLCCCPTLKLYASSSLDCTIRIWTLDNRLLRLLQLNGAPQALAFCSNGGDLVLALGSRLCLVSHRHYLPTAYLVKKLCRKAPDVVDDPPLPLSNHESLTSSQLQKLTNLHGADSLSVALPFTHRQTPTLQQPLLEEDLEALEARDQDLQQLRQGLVVPVARPLPSWKQRQEAFDNYLRLIYGCGLLSRMDSQQGSTLSLTKEKELQDTCTLPSAASDFREAVVSTEAQTSMAPPLQALGTPGQHCPTLPELPCPFHLSTGTSAARHPRSAASVRAAPREDGCSLGPSSFKQKKVPLLLKREPKEPLLNLSGFFPATTKPYKYYPRPISFPGYVPNSMVLQQMWLHQEVAGLGSLAHLDSWDILKSGSEDSEWLRRRHRRSTSRWQRRLTQWLRGQSEDEEEEEEEEEEQELEFVWSSSSLYSDQQQDYSEQEAQGSMDAGTGQWSFQKIAKIPTYFGSLFRYKHSPLEERYGHLPEFLRFFIVQNWFKKLFPLFTLEAYPEMGTVEGLASMLVDILAETTWADRVHILHALMRLVPDVSSELRSRLQGSILHLLNLEQPPTFQDEIQKQFVILALRLLLACSLESRDVVLELMCYFLYSPATYRPEIKKLLDGLGLQDLQDFLSKELLTWVQGPDLNSKAVVRTRCCQKLEDMIQQLQMETLQLPAPRLSLPTASQTSALLSPREAMSRASLVSGARLSIPWTTPRPSEAFWRDSEVPLLVVSPSESETLDYELQVRRTLAQLHTRRTKEPLSETLQRFCSVSDAFLPATLRGETVPLEKTEWSQSQIVDLRPVDALNLFCERAHQHSSMQEEAGPLSPLPRGQVPNTVVRPPRDRWLYPILRLQESRAPRSWMRGHRLSRIGTGRTRNLDCSIQVLKLPLPRVELQPFPPGWPAPARALPPRLLQPALQRYFLPEDADPGTYRGAGGRRRGPHFYSWPHPARAHLE